MGQIQHQSTKNAIYIYSGAAIGLGSNILFGNYLTPAENGVLALIVSFGGIIGAFCNLGFGYAGVRYFPEMRSETKHHHGYLNASIKYSLMALVVASVIFLSTKTLWVKEDNLLFSEYYVYSLVIALATVLFNALSVYMRFNFNSTTPTLSKEFVQRLLLVLFFIPFIFDFLSFKSYVNIYVGVFMIIPFGLYFFIKRKGYWYIKDYFGELDEKFRKRFWRACGYGMITAVGASALMYLDSIMVNSLLSTGETGIYVRNFYFATIILMASRAVANISQTHISEAFKENDLLKVNDIYSKSCLTQTIVGLLFFLGIWGNVDNIYRILPQEFSAGRFVILIIGLGNMMTMITGTNQLIIGASPYYKINTYTVFILLGLAVAFNFLFIPKYGITGAAIATALSTTVFSTLRSLFIYYKYKMQPYDWRYLVIIITGIMAWWVSTLLPQLDSLFVDLILRSGIITLLFVLPIYLLKVSSDINSLIEKTITSALRLFRR